LTRWFPGTLTNWPSIFDFISRVKNNPELISETKHPKNFRRWQALKGLQTLKSRPDILVLLHAKDHFVAINESRQTGTPSIGIVDSDANGLGLTFPV
jgi:ribosomal protein S2